MTHQPIDTLSGSIRAGLACACPRCGRGKLFDGFLTLRPRCDACRLDYGFADAGDAGLPPPCGEGLRVGVTVMANPPYALPWLTRERRASESTITAMAFKLTSPVPACWLDVASRAAESMPPMAASVEQSTKAEA